MANDTSTGDGDNDGSGGGLAVALLFVGLILGMLIGTLVLVVVPSTHRFLRTKYETLRGLCARRGREKQSNKDAQNQGQRDTNYTEIEEPNHPPRLQNSMKRKNGEFAGTTITVNKYEQCMPNTSRTEHSYSAVSSEGVVPQQKAKPVERYEYMSVRRELNQRLNIVENDASPIYSILEPGSNKKMPVTMVTNESSNLVSDSNHVYFVLEPGTKKVKPVFQASLTPDDDHVYFVLNVSEQNTDAEAYAVSDIDEPMYFVLEKQ